MEFDLIIKGIIFGFAVAAPVGPIAVLCMQKTLNKGFISGIVSGLGSAFSDLFYAIIAGFSLTFISDFLVHNQFSIRIGGGIILIFMGLKIAFTDTGKQVRKHRREGNKLFTDFVTTFFLTITNPSTIIAFIAIFSGTQVIHPDSSNLSISILVFSVFLGAVIWYFILVGIIYFFKKKIRLKHLWWINKITGVLIVLFAFFVIASVFIFNPI